MKRYEETKAYRDQSIAWLLPTRGTVPIQVVDSWDALQWPMNQFRTSRLSAVGMEVGAAYNLLTRIVTDRKTATEVLGSKEYADMVLGCRFVLTTEEDNVLPPDGIQKLLTAIYTCPDCGREVGVHCAGKKRQCKQCSEWRCEKGHKGYDAVAGLYAVKADPPIPMAFGDPKKGPNDFKPRSVMRAYKAAKVLEVNGIPMGFSLFRKDMFRQMSKPWFQTSQGHTQDLFACKKAKREFGARFAVHCGVVVGHLHTDTGKMT